MIAPPKAVLLDMDDTIIAFEHGIDLDACWTKVCSAHLGADDAAAVDSLVTEIKAQAGWYWSDAGRHREGRMDLAMARTRIVESALRQLKLEDKASWPRSIAIDYGTERNNAIYPFAGAIETIRTIRSLGIKLVMITNGTSIEQRSKIERFGLAPLFDHILIEGEFGSGKPETSVYEHALQLVGVQPQDAWMIGDNYEWEVIAPQRLGIRGVWISHNRPLPQSSSAVNPPFLSISSLSELQAYL